MEDDHGNVIGGRTAENVKDKWKQLGGDNAQLRKKGPWILQESL